MTMIPGQGPQFPFNYPTPYSPGQMAFNNNAELSQLITMFAGPLMGAMAGPGNFMPNMMPGQALADQFAMMNYQNQTRMATFNMAGAQNQDVASGLLGIRSAFTNTKASEMNKEQAMNMAGILNNPYAKTFMGMMMGPENVEAMLHGSRGDVQNLGASVNRAGYFQRDPSGSGRMDAESLEDLTTGVFSHLYEPQGDVTKLADTARAGGSDSANAISRLQKAAAMEDRAVVTDDDLQSRLQNISPTRVDQLYKKYVQGGEAKDAATQAKELTKFNRAINEAGVLDSREVSIGQLEKAAYDRPTQEMNGFMAGQVSQLHENLFQRGILPPGIGNLDAKGRVDAIAETKLDPGTIDRLAEKMAQRELAAKDAVGPGGKAFSQMTETEQQAEIKKSAGAFKTQIEATKQAADDAAAGKDGAKSVEEIMQMGGAEALAGNVDASRTASRLKEYTESIAAVRDIFGDNGNPNAPMPALMAALDHLTQGAMGSMNPATTATTLRQMQTMARETGTGMHQLAVMSQQAGAMGQQLGIMPAITMQNVAATMGLTKAAMDRGAFSTQTPGAMSKEQFQQEAMTRLQTGDASDNAKTMATLNRIYQTNKEKYAGTELEAAMEQAYNNAGSDGTYTYFDKKLGKQVTRNLYEDIGKGRMHAGRDLLMNAGGDVNEFNSLLFDKRTHTEEFLRSGRGFMTQKHDLIQELNAFGADSFVRGSLEGTAVGDDLGLEGQNVASQALTEMVLDSSKMGVTKQIGFLEKNMEAQLVKKFVSQGMDHDKAKKAAKQVVQTTFGDGKGGIDKSRIGRLIGDIGTVAGDVYGKNTVELNQLYSNAEAGAAENAAAIARAESTNRMVGTGPGPVARISDYFMDIGKRGEKFNFDSFLKEMAPTISNKELLRQYAGEMGAGLHTLSSMRDKVEVTQSYVDKLAKEGKIDELKKLGGVKDDETVVRNATLEKERTKRLGALSGDKLKEEYQAVFGRSGGGLSDKQMRKDLQGNTTFNQRSDEEFMGAEFERTGKAQITEEALQVRAMRSVGKALEGMEGKQEDLEAVMSGLYRGRSDKNARAAGLNALGRVFKDGSDREFLGHSETEIKKLAEMSGDDGRKAVLKKLGISEEDFTKNKSLDPDKKSDKQKMAEALVGFQSNVDLSKMGDEKAATGPDQKQRADKVDLQATNVYVNGAKAAGSTPAEAAAAAGTPEGKTPTDIGAIDAEMAALMDKRKDGYLWDYFPDKKDEERYRELSAQRQKLVAEQKQQKEDTAAAAEPEKKPDAPIAPPVTTADAEKAKELKEKTDAGTVQTSVAVTPDEAKAIIAEEQARAEKQKADAAEVAAAGATVAQTSASTAPESTAHEGPRSLSLIDAYRREYGMPTLAESTTPPGEAGAPDPTALPPEKTAALQQAAAEGRLGSANVQPGASAGPQQQADAASATAAVPGNASGREAISLNGSLRLEGLHEAIIAATGEKAVATPSGGPPVVGTGNMGQGGLPSGNRNIA